MKKMIVASLILACISLVGMETVSAQKKASASIYLEFGKKSQPDCPKFGFCKFHLELFGWEVSYNMDSRSDPKSLPKGTFTIDEKTNTCKVTFKETEVRQKAPDKVSELALKKFYVDEDIPLSGSANNAFGVKKTTPMVIKAGVYTMTSSGGEYSVTIPLK